jgi:hypothetical protein
MEKQEAVYLSVGGIITANLLIGDINNEQLPNTCKGKGLEPQIFNLKINFK